MTSLPQDFSWRAPAHQARAEIREKNSRFLGDIVPAMDAGEAARHLAGLKQEFPRATHHCWALSLRQGAKLVQRCSDAGEPAGSAGLPLLRALEAAEVEGASLVVVRWFGGVKLGVGPLSRAYRAAAAAVLEEAGTETCCFYRLLRVRYPHDCSGSVRRAFSRLGVVIREERPGAAAETLVRISESRCEALRAALTDASRGQATVDDAGRVAEALA